MATSIPSLSNSDRFSRILRKSKLSPIKVTLVAAAITLFVNVLLAILFDAWRSTSSTLGFIDDWPGLYSFIALPAIIGYLSWFQYSS